MIKALAAMAVAATLFIQFRDPATDALMFETDENGEFKLDGDGNKLPLGVRVYTPGSKQYRAAEAKIATEGIKRGRKGLTGDTILDNQTRLLALTTTEYVGFDVDGQPASYETNYKLYDDPEYVAVREQVATAQGDLGNATLNTSKG